MHALTISMAPEKDLESLLLDHGGDRVAPGNPGRLLQDLLKRGRVFPASEPAQQPLGEDFRHSSSARLWYESGGRIKIAIGYALAGDGVWQGHSWGVEDGRVVETTATSRNCYFGVELSHKRSATFAVRNPYPNFRDIFERDEETGGRYSEAGHVLKWSEHRGKRFRYYDVARHWAREIEPHLSDRRLNQILVRDFNKFTYGRWRERFEPGQVPFDFESCDWHLDHRGRHPRFWSYVKHSACHWLVNFNLRLATLARPNRPWRIITSDLHSTVWDGDRTLFDLNFTAFRVPPQECFYLASGTELPVGVCLKTYYVAHYREE